MDGGIVVAATAEASKLSRSFISPSEEATAHAGCEEDLDGGAAGGGGGQRVGSSRRQKTRGKRWTPGRITHAF